MITRFNLRQQDARLCQTNHLAPKFSWFLHLIVVVGRNNNGKRELNRRGAISEN